MGTGTSASRRCLLCEVVWDSMACFARMVALLLALSRVQSSGNLRLPYVTQHIGSGGSLDPTSSSHMLVRAQPTAGTVTVAEAECAIRTVELQLEQLQQLEQRLQSALAASVSRQRGRRRRTRSSRGSRGGRRSRSGGQPEKPRQPPSEPAQPQVPAVQVQCARQELRGTGPSHALRCLCEVLGLLSPCS